MARYGHFADHGHIHRFSVLLDCHYRRFCQRCRAAGYLYHLYPGRLDRIRPSDPGANGLVSPSGMGSVRPDLGTARSADHAAPYFA
ncbi:hypothetical protein D1872_307170 [compost metagenome]